MTQTFETAALTDDVSSPGGDSATVLTAGLQDSLKRRAWGVVGYRLDGSLFLFDGDALPAGAGGRTLAELEAVLRGLRLARDADERPFRVQTRSPWIANLWGGSPTERPEPDADGDVDRKELLMHFVTGFSETVDGVTLGVAPKESLRPALDVAIAASQGLRLPDPPPILTGVAVRYDASVLKPAPVPVRERVVRTAGLARMYRLQEEPSNALATLSEIAPEEIREIWGPASQRLILNKIIWHRKEWDGDA